VVGFLPAKQEDTFKILKARILVIFNQNNSIINLLLTFGVKITSDVLHYNLQVCLNTYTILKVNEIFFGVSPLCMFDVMTHLFQFIKQTTPGILVY